MIPRAACLGSERRPAKSGATFCAWRRRPKIRQGRQAARAAGNGLEQSSAHAIDRMGRRANTLVSCPRSLHNILAHALSAVSRRHKAHRAEPGAEHCYMDHVEPLFPIPLLRSSRLLSAALNEAAVAAIRNAR